MAYDWVADLTGEPGVPEPLALSWAPASLRTLAIDADQTAMLRGKRA